MPFFSRHCSGQGVMVSAKGLHIFQAVYHKKSCPLRRHCSMSLLFEYMSVDASMNVSGILVIDFSALIWFELLYKCAHIMCFLQLSFISNFVNVTDSLLANLYCSFYGAVHVPSSNPPTGALRSCNCPLDFKSLAQSVNNDFQQH